VRVDTGGVPYPVFAYSALVPWTLFSTSLGYGIPSLVTNMNLVTKVYFPREVLPLASIGAALVDFSISFVLLIFLMLYYQIYPDVTLAWIPLLLIVQTMLSIGLVLFGSSIVVFFRDIRFIVPLLIQVWLYATPIIYPVTLVPERFRTVYFLNPMAGIIEGYRSVLISGRAPDVRTLSMAGIISTVTLVGGYLFFKHFEPIFADVI
jgi:lipopolysaccharide transport system permease protein